MSRDDVLLHCSHNEMPDTVAEQIKHTLYMAGWGYVVSRDCAHVVVSKYDHLINNKRLRPAWCVFPCDINFCGCLLTEICC